LIGRAAECDALAQLLVGVQAGQSASLVLRGEPGVGKTALLDHAVEVAEGFRVVRIAGVEPERELPFAALHQLCGPMSEHFDRLPGPQRAALAAAFGLAEGGSRDRFLVGLAVLSLLADVAEGAPLLCVVDDAQSVDKVSRQTLAFVARRLCAESVAMVFATRTSSSHELMGLPEQVVGGLAHHEAVELLATVFPGPLDDRVRDRLVAESQGNPLALLELPNDLDPAELAGGFALTRPLPVSGRIEESYRRRLRALPDETQQLLLLAAAEPLGDPALLWRAASYLDLGGQAATPAERAGLVQFDGLVRFRHPLVRSAVYRASGPGDRRRVHAALAEATDALDSDRRAWHRAKAAAGPDDEIAAELDRSAIRAQNRGGVAAAAAFLEHAANLTAEPGERAERALRAAQLKYEAGAPLAASTLMAMAEAGPLGPLPRALLERLRAQIEFSLRRGGAAPLLFLRAARMIEPLDAALARSTYLEAMTAALYARGLGHGCGPRDVALAARSAPRPAGPPRVVDHLLDGLITLYTLGYAPAVPLLRQAVGALRAEPHDIFCVGLACHAAGLLWDLRSRSELADLQAALAREAGALATLPLALNLRASTHLLQGNLEAAESMLEEADAVTEATGNAPLTHIWLMLAAWRGQESQVASLLDASLRDAESRGEGNVMAVAEQAAALFHNGHGEYRTALAAVQHERALDEMFGTWGLPEVVEAAARSGERSLAIATVERLAEQTAPSGTDWAIGMEARSRALISQGFEAEELYRVAIEHLGRSGAGAHLARARLLFGEWLRRQRRRAEAREQLRIAHDSFVAMGAAGFAARSSRALLAMGERTSERTLDSVGRLTGQEAQIARLARDGQTNAEIGAQLFISPRTVEYHLGKVFTKLGIDSRSRLDEKLELF
jgi:DNA-binding CsgD family transcriptional regulator